MMRMYQTLSRLVLVIPFLLVGTTGLAQEEVEHDATVKLQTTSVAIGIGVTWGDGILTMRQDGTQYAFSVDGLSLVDVGVSKVEAAGTVYYMKDIADFEGKYTAAGAGLTIGVGAGEVAMKNDKGVVIKLGSTAKGIQFRLAAGGASFKLKEKIGS